MASVANDPGGRRRILFVAPDGSRKTIRLGKIDRKGAEAVGRHVEALLAAKISGQPIPRDTAVWLAAVGEPLLSRLAAAGLVAARKKKAVSELLAEHLARQDVKPSTKAIRAVWGRQLVQLLGDRPVQSITARDAEAVRDGLVRSGLAPATVGRQLRFARQLFRLAVLGGAIDRNPFDALAHNFREGNLPQRDYAPADDVERLLAVCPPPWRVLVGLARYAALRCPSEALLLRWSDVDLPGRRLTVSSPKTESQGKPWRVVPVAPRLAELLSDAWELAPAGAGHVVDLPQYRGKSGNWVGCNLRTQLARLMRRAGVLWKRPFRVLRSSCVTDWAREHPVHCVAAWAGHTVPVAGRHYLTVTDADFARATGGAKSGAPAAQKEAQQASAARCGERQSSPQALGGCEPVPLDAVPNSLLHKDLATRPGFEPPSFSSGNRTVSARGGAESGAPAPETAPAGPDLAAIWPTLPEEVRAAITAAIRAARRQG